MGSPTPRSAQGPEPEGTPLAGLPEELSPASAVASEPRGDLMRAGARGVMWQGLAQVVAKLVVLVTTIILARLLSPEEFGLVSLALVLIAYAEAVADAGMAQALVYLPRTPASVRAALACSMLSGILLLLFALLLAPSIASFFGRPDASSLVRLLAVSLLAASLGALPEALLRRELAFRRLTAATVVRAITSGGVAVGLAFAGHGAWALAWGTVAGTVSYAAATWALLPERPDLAVWRTTRAGLRQVLGYGMPVAGSTMLAKLIFDVDYLIIGRLLGATALGYEVVPGLVEVEVAVPRPHRP